MSEIEAIKNSELMTEAKSQSMIEYQKNRPVSKKSNIADKLARK